MAVLIDVPWLAAGPRIAFAALWVRTRRRLVLVAAASWLGYLAYELGMRARLSAPAIATFGSICWSSIRAPREEKRSSLESMALDASPCTLVAERKEHQCPSRIAKCSTGAAAAASWS